MKTISGAAKVLTTIGRFAPFHRGHQEAFLEVWNDPQSLIFLGAAEDKYRFTIKDPFSVSQRTGMIQAVYPNLGEKNFSPYWDTAEGRTNPPSLDGMVRQIKGVCDERGINFSSLVFVVPFKPEDGHDVMIEGKVYSNTHHLIATAQHYGLDCKILDLKKENGALINATDLRKDLPKNFHLLDPKVLRYIQDEMQLSVLNNRLIGADQSGDKYKIDEARGAVGALSQENKMLGFDLENPGMAKIVDVPQERQALFSRYFSVGLNPKLKSVQAVVSEEKFTQI